jgi:hypothetical protein
MNRGTVGPDVGIEAYRQALSLLPDEDPGDADLDEPESGNELHLSDQEKAEVQARLEQVRAEKVAAVARGDLGEVERAKQTKRGVFWAEPKYPKRKRESGMSLVSHWVEKRKADAERLFQIERAHPLASPAKLRALFEKQTGKPMNSQRFRQIYQEAGRSMPIGEDDDSEPNGQAEPEAETPKLRRPRKPRAVEPEASPGTDLAVSSTVEMAPPAQADGAWQAAALAGIEVELAAMGDVVKALGRLDRPTASRVLDWVKGRLNLNGQ